MTAMKETTVTEAAAQLGYSRERVHQICHSRGIGRMVTPQLRLLSEKDVKAVAKILSSMKIGRPRKNVEQSA